MTAGGSRPSKKGDHIKRVGIVFSGGPAPAANAVISSAAISFLEDGREVRRVLPRLLEPAGLPPGHAPAAAGRALPHLRARRTSAGLRNTRGIVIGTARANPGKGIEKPADLDDPKKTQRLRNVYNALVDLEIDALISIGGDDTLKTANFLYEYQKRLPEEARRVQVVHLPKTIDNDYRGIDFTFGFFTAVDVMAKELQNLRADAIATSSYFIVETMGRKAGWLSYGVAIAGEANLVLAVEDVTGALTVDGKGKHLSLDALVDRIVDLIIDAREARQALRHGRARRGPRRDAARDADREPAARRARPPLARPHRSRQARRAARDEALRAEAPAARRRSTGLQLGYESRCAPPHAFDVMLGSQLGIGAYRALVEENLDGHMVSVSGQLDLHYVPFKELVNPKTLKTEVRFIEPGSDFHRLARFLETRTDKIVDWSPGRRHER